MKINRPLIAVCRAAWLALAVLGCLAALPRTATAASLGIPCSPGSDMSSIDINCRDPAEGDFRNPMPNAYLSIAMSSSMAAGAAWAPSQQEANARAIADCSRRSPTPCKIAWSRLNACAALATSPSEKIASIGALEGAGFNASGLAMTNCARAGGHQCQVVVSACSTGYVSPRVWTPLNHGASGYQPPAYQAPVLRLPRRQ